MGLLQAYFNYIYNPCYDFVTGQLPAYRRLQSRCINKLEFRDGDSVLCVGAGTGNEILLMLNKNPNLNIVAVDYSGLALKRAYKKALALGKEISTVKMDARNLMFSSESFDNVVCIHVMDFITGDEQVTNEILRTVKKDGQFLVTYPSAKESASLGIGLLRDSLRLKDGESNNRFTASMRSLFRLLLTAVYAPLLIRPKRKFFSRAELTSTFESMSLTSFEIDEDHLYWDFIVSGRK